MSASDQGGIISFQNEQIESQTLPITLSVRGAGFGEPGAFNTNFDLVYVNGVDGNYYSVSARFLSAFTGTCRWLYIGSA